MLPKDSKSWKNFLRFFETNAVGLSKLVESLMSRKYLKNFIQIGTSEMYGSVKNASDEESKFFHPALMLCQKLLLICI